MASSSIMDEESDLTQQLIVPTPGDNGGGGSVGICGRILNILTCGRSGGGSNDLIKIKPYQELIISPKLYKRSVNCLRFAVFVDAVAGTIEQPNYPIMVSAGDHPDSFPDTSPFGFSAATYFVPMTALLGVAIASLVIGRLSDFKGRKPCLLFCLYGTVVGCILKYILRKSFWPYCAMNFLNGLFSASVPVALAYAGDVNETKREKDAEIGLLVGVSMLGTAGGGIIAILMETQGLFAPLLVGSALALIGALLNTFMLIEPKDILASRSREREMLGLEAEDEDEEDGGVVLPTELNYKVLANILIGALGDNVGSSGLMPLCLSPLAFSAFYQEFENQGLDPIMSQVAYKWISVLVALTVVPGTIVSPKIYNTIGLAGGCILGNVVTGIVTIILLYIALIKPATNVTFGIFVALLYLSFPMTVISQLSTGPMLEATSPADKRGFCQGINITVMNFGAACSPFVLGLISDNLGTPTAIWICVGISFIAALINVPLIFVKGCNVPPKPRPAERRPLRGEDKEMVEKALRGEWIPADALEEINDHRFRNGQPYLIVHPRSYQEDKAELHVLRKRAKKDFGYHQLKTREYLHGVNTADDLGSVCEKINASMQASDPDEVQTTNQEIGQWVMDYLVDSGYSPHLSSLLIKQAIMSAFPVLSPDIAEEGYTPENIERSLLQLEKVYTNLSELEGFDEPKNMTLVKVLNNARSAIYQQTI